MDESPNEHDHSDVRWLSGMVSGFRAALFLCLLLPALYVLSLGPVIWLFNHGVIPRNASRAINSFYAPLQWLHDWSDVAGQLLDWYATLL